MNLDDTKKRVQKYLNSNKRYPLIVDVQTREDLANIAEYFKVGSNKFPAIEEFCNQDEAIKLDELYASVSSNSGNTFITGLSGFLMLFGENVAKQMCWRDAREKPVPVMKMSEVEETVVQWLWYPFIPFGKVTLIQGNPGKGKTWLAMAIAAYCTNGKELPNALPIEPFNVLYQTAEDGIADTIKPRLAKCGADMTRVRFINEDEKQLSMTDDRIEKAIRQNNVRLMIMDPIQAYLGANVDMNRANEIRPLFRHLSTIAERTGCAIVLIGHLNKSSGSQSDYRSLGSIDIAAAVRSILFVEKVEKEKEQDIRVVYQQKDSLAKKENPVAFSLGEEGLKWLGEYDISIEDLLMGKAGTKKETKLEKAQKLILELLTKRKVMCLEELEAELLAYGISSRTGRDARKQLENRMSYDWCQGRKTVALTTE